MVVVTKDAGDDLDVTHGVVVRVMVEPDESGGGVRFAGGEGVGTVTLLGLPLSMGESAINSKPYEYIIANIIAAVEHLGIMPDVCVTVSTDDGARVAEKTWNSRIGVLGGLSVLGTISVVAPYLCSARIASIHRGIGVAIAAGAMHAAVCIESTSERVVEELYPSIELLDMDDFASAVPKHLRKYPLPGLAIVGGVAKLSKPTAGYLDLHSHRTRIQPGHLHQLVEGAGASPGLVEAIGEAAAVAHAATLAGEVGIDLSQLIAGSACDEIPAVLGGAPVGVEIVVIDRAGKILARVY